MYFHCEIKLPHPLLLFTFPARFLVGSSKPTFRNVGNPAKCWTFPTMLEVGMLEYISDARVLSRPSVEKESRRLHASVSLYTFWFY